MGRSALRDLHIAQRGWGASPLPGLRFFTATEAFWALFEQPGWKDRRWIEAGAGLGDTTEEAEARGLDMTAVDLNEREGQSAKVLPLNALALPYGAETWALVCRPDHSGWCYFLIEKVLSEGGSVLYVGLDRNVDNDLDEFMDQAVQIAQDVGEEGEHAWLISPRG